MPLPSSNKRWVHKRNYIFKNLALVGAQENNESDERINQDPNASNSSTSPQNVHRMEPKQFMPPVRFILGDESQTILNQEASQAVLQPEPYETERKSELVNPKQGGLMGNFNFRALVETQKANYQIKRHLSNGCVQPSRAMKD